MSTRHERAANKQQNDEHVRILKSLMALPENKVCSDCRRKDPRWASWNLGIFFCIRCSGFHRSLGTHISKVKSADLDTWTPEQIENMVKWGNAKANKYWEAQLPNDFEPEESQIESFIRSKYERKQFAASKTIPDPSEMTGGSTHSIKTNSSSINSYSQHNSHNGHHANHAHHNNHHNHNGSHNSSANHNNSRNTTNDLLGDIFASLPSTNSKTTTPVVNNTASLTNFNNTNSINNYSNFNIQPQVQQQRSQQQQQQQQKPKSTPTVDDLLMF